MIILFLIDDGLRLTVTKIQNESSCKCKESSTTKALSTEFTTETTPSMSSTIEKSQRKMKTNGKSH